MRKAEFTEPVRAHTMLEAGMPEQRTHKGWSPEKSNEFHVAELGRMVRTKESITLYKSDIYNKTTMSCHSSPAKPITLKIADHLSEKTVQSPAPQIPIVEQTLLESQSASLDRLGISLSPAPCRLPF